MGLERCSVLLVHGGEEKERLGRMEFVWNGESSDTFFFGTILVVCALTKLAPHVDVFEGGKNEIKENELK